MWTEHCVVCYKEDKKFRVSIEKILEGHLQKANTDFVTMTDRQAGSSSAAKLVIVTLLPFIEL